MTQTKKTSRAISKLTGIVMMLLALFATILIAAAAQTYFFPQKANVAGSVQVTFTLNGTAWANGTGWDWGITQPGEWTNVSLNVYNSGNTNDSLVLLPASLPSIDWMETWTLNNTVIKPTETLTGTLSLYVPAAWPPGNVTMSSIAILVNQV